MRTWIKAAAAALALAGALVGPAAAQIGRTVVQRPEIFSVAGVVADVTGESAAAARPAAFTEAQRKGFARLAARITPADQQGAVLALRPTDAQLAALQAGIDIEDERSSRTLYIGRFTVHFDPPAVRAYLRAANIATIETRGAMTLVAAQFDAGSPQQQAQWRQAWAEGGFGGELTPVAVAPVPVQGAPSWAAVEAAAAGAGAATAIYAALRTEPGALSVELDQVSAQRPPEALGRTSVRLASADPAAFEAGLRELSARANALIQDSWKQSLVAGAATRTRLQGTVLFTSQREWQAVKQGLSAASATVVSDVRIDALARGGAMVSFTYVGPPENLAAVLRQNSVDIQIEGGAALLRPIGRPG